MEDGFLGKTDFLNVELPNLIYFILDNMDKYRRIFRIVKTTMIEKCLQKNSHTLKTVELRGFHPNYLKTINELVPRLEHLVLKLNPQIDYTNEPIRFENVRTLDIDKTIQESTVENVVFPMLEKLSMNHVGEWSSLLNVFFMNHKHLTKLNIFASKEFGVESSLNFEPLNCLTDLTEMSLILRKHVVSVENIINFFETHKKLTKFQLSMQTFPKDYEQVIRENFETNWIIGDFGIIKQAFSTSMEGFSLVRKR